MKTFMRLAMLFFAVLSLSILGVDSVVAKSAGRNDITVVLVSPDGRVLMHETMPSAVPLSAAFELEPGSINRGQLRRGAVKQNIDGLVQNMKARLTMSTPLQQPTGDMDALSRPMDIPGTGETPIGGGGGGGGGGGSKCLTLFVAPGTNEILCASSCRNCYYEEVNP